MGKYDDNIVSTLKYNPPMSPEFREIYERFAKRVLWLDSNIVPGAMQLNMSWYNKTPDVDPIFDEHSHPESEIVAFFGTDNENPYDMDAEIEFVIDGEPHTITSSSLVFVPGGVPHTLRIKRISKPVFHFSVMSGGEYNNSSYK